MQRRTGFVFLALALLACKNDEPEPKTATPTGSASSSPSEVAPSGAASASGAGAGGTARLPIPKIETACTADSDCVITSDDVDGAHACCPGCAQHAGNKTWYAQFQSACKASPPPECPALGCAMPIVHAACVSHVCTAVPTK